MAMNMEAALRLKVGVDGANGIQTFSRDLKNLQNSAKLTTADLGRFAIEINRAAREGGNTTQSLRAQIQALTALRERVDIGSNAYKRFGDQLTTLKAKLQGIEGGSSAATQGFLGGLAGGGAYAAIMGLASGLTQVGQALFDTGAKFQQIQLALKAFTGDAVIAAQTFQAFKQIAIESPFNTEQIAQAGKTLLAFGLDATETTDAMKRLAAIAGATGSDINNLAVNLGQIKAQGKATATDLRQFALAGVPIWQALSDVTGENVATLQKYVSEGKVGYADIQMALKFLTQENSSFANLAKEQADSLAGKWETFNSAVQALEVSVVRLLTPAFVGFLDIAIRGIGDLAKELDDVTTGLFEVAKGLEPVTNGLGQVFRISQAINGVPVFRAMTDSLRGLVLQLNPAIGTLTQLWGLMRNIGQFKSKGKVGNNAYQIGDTMMGPGPEDIPYRLLRESYKPFSGAPEGGGGSKKKGSKAKAPEDYTKEEFSLRQQIISAKASENTLDELRLERELAIYQAQKLQGTPLKTKVALAQAELDLQNKLQAMFSGYSKEVADSVQKTIDKRNEEITQYNQLRLASGTLTKDEERQLKINEEILRIQTKYPELWARAGVELQAYIEKSKGLTTEQEKNKKIVDGIADSVGGSLKSGFDALINGTENWGNSLRDIAGNLLKSIADQLLQIMVIAPIVEAIKGIKFAKGGVFEGGAVTPFAMGGIVDKPTIFPFAKGIGLMGEAGPEAIMPLKRGADGKLGVAGGGGGSTTINVSVDAKGSNVEGDASQSKQLAVVISAAIQAEMVKQQRPGGLLSSTRR
jgi:tape measure domain-containing protein